MKEYGHLLRDDPQWADRARAFSAKCKDITEILCELAPVAPRHPLPHADRLPRRLPPPSRARHLPAAAAICSQIRSLEVAEIAESSLCCGSAGVYNLLQPEPAQQLGDRKVGHLLDTRSQAVVSANPGCLLQLIAASAAAAKEHPAFHMVQLLDASIRGLSPQELLRPD